MMTKIATKIGCSREGQMVRARRKFTGLVDTHQTPLIEYVYDTEHAEAFWRIWLSYNLSRDAGTYLVLRSDGSITRETLHPSGEVTRVGTVKPAES